MNHRETRSGLTLLTGIAIGAGIMALIDTGRGAQRRTYLRDKLLHTAKQAGRQMSRNARYYWNDVYGQLQERRARMSQHDVSDEVLEERVKANSSSCRMAWNTSRLQMKKFT